MSNLQEIYVATTAVCNYFNKKIQKSEINYIKLLTKMLKGTIMFND